MTNMHISVKELQKYIGKNIGIERLKNKISMMGTDLDGIDGDEITVEIFPNRPDLLSFHGFARALAAFLEIKPGIKLYDVNKSMIGEYKVFIDKSVSKVRPYTVCAVVKGLKFTDENIKEIIDIQEKLHLSFGRNRKRLAIGIYPLEKIKMPIRYLAKKPDEFEFIPLEWKVPMNGYEILEDHPTGREYAKLLEGKEVFPLFMDANDEILSMPPIINSEKTGRVTENTKDIFIECSGHNLHVLNQTLNMITTALADMGGKIFAMELNYPDKKIVTPDLSPKTIRVNLSYIEKIIGVEVKNISDLLSKMNMSLEEKNGDELVIKYPPYRTDIMHPIDIVEDIAIAYGYDNIPEEIPNISTVGEESNLERFKRKVVDILIGYGLLETSTFHLITEEMNNLFSKNFIKVMDSKTEYKYLRTSMFPSMMNVLKTNLHNEYPQKIFEIGRIFNRDKDKYQKITDIEYLGIMLADKDANYTTIRQILDGLFNLIELKVKYLPVDDDRFINGRSALIKVNDKKLGIIGELHPKIISKLGIEVPVAACELNFIKMFGCLNLD